MPVKSHKVQREARHSPKQRNFARDSEGKTKVLSKKKEACSEVLSKDKKACSSSDFDRQDAPKDKKNMLEQ